LIYISREGAMSKLLKHRLPRLSLFLTLILIVQFTPSQAQGASTDSPKVGQMVIINKTPHDTWPIELKVSLYVEAPPKALWRVLTDYENMDEFVPHLQECNIVDRRGSKIYLEQTFKHFPITAMHLDLEIKEEPPHKILFKRYAGNMKTYEGHWLLEQAGPKSTIFTLEVKAEPDFPVPQQVMAWVLESELPKGLLAMRKRALKIAGQPEPPYSIEIISR